MEKVVRRPVVYRHANHAEWGHGIIVEENPSRVCVAFEDGGRRPFLNEPKYRKLLIAVLVPPAQAEALAAKLVPPPKKKPGRKPKKVTTPPTA